MYWYVSGWRRGSWRVSGVEADWVVQKDILGVLMGINLKIEAILSMVLS